MERIPQIRFPAVEGIIFALGVVVRHFEMEIIKDKITGDLVIDKDVQYQDVEVDTLIIQDNKTARVFGIVKKLIHIKKNATVYFHGKLIGKVINEGGQFHAFDA